MDQDYQTKYFQYKIVNKKKLLWILLLFLLSFITVNAQNCVVNAGVLNETICATDSMRLIGNTPSPINGSVLWSQISGPSVTITSPNSTTTTVSGYTGGNTYVFRYSATCGDGILAYQDKTVVVMPITIANAGSNIASCPNSSGAISVTGNTPLNAGETGHWEITGGNNAGVVINLHNSSTTTLTLPPTSCGVSTLSWIIEGPEYAPGQKCSSSSSITVTNYGGVTPVTAGSDITLGNCYTTTQNVNLNGSFGGCGLNGQNGTWTFVTGPSTPTIANANANNTNISNLQEGTYVFRWTVVGPCISGSDEVSITVPPATQDVTNLGGGTENIYFCDNTVTQVSLVGQVPSYANETVLWTQTGGGACIIQSPTSSTTLVTGISDAGDPYTFRYTLTNSVTGCTSYKDYVVEYKASDRTILANNGDNIFGECDQTDFSIPITVTGSGANKYRILSGPATSPLAPFPTVTKSVGNNLDISLMESGIYILQFVRSENGDLPVGCDYGFDNLAIVVSANATPSNAGSDVNLDCGVTIAPLAGVGIAGAGNHYWTQISGPNTATIVDKLEQNTTATGLISGTYEFQYITKGGGTKCPLSIDNVTVYVSSSTLSAANAGADVNSCVNSQVVLDGSIPAPGEFGLWTQISGPDMITFSDSGDPHAVASGFVTTGSSNVLQWTIGYTHPGTGGCSAPVSDTMTVTTVAGLGTTIANAGPDACYPNATTSVNLVGNNAGILEQGTWTVTPSLGVSFVDIHASSTTATIPSNGTYTFSWTIVPNVGSCGSSSDDVIVTVAADATTAVAGPDQSLCGTTATMDATLPSGATGIWTRVSGLENYTISDETDPKAVFTFQNTGPYVFRWTITAGNCSTGSDDVKITIGIPPTAANAGPDQNICSSNSTTLAGNSYDTFFELGAWTLLAGAPNVPVLADATSPTTAVSNLVQGTYTFRWTVGSKGNFLCPVTFDDVIIEVAPLATAGPDQVLCNVTSVQLVGTENSKGTWTQTGGSTTGVVITQTPSDSYVANVTVVPGNTYQFTYTTSGYNFASGGNCTGSSDNVSVTVNGGASFPPNAGVDQTICNADNSTVTLAGNTAPSGTSSEWQWVLQPTGSVANINFPTSPNTQVTGLTVQGLYILKWVFKSPTCTDLSDIVRINVYQAPSQANAGPDDTVACQQSYTTNAVAPAVGIGKWTFSSEPSGGNAIIDSPNNPKTTLSNVTVLGTYVLTWTVTNGPFTSPSLCAPSSDQVSITFNATPPSIANAGPDQKLCSVVQTNLAATAVTSGKGTWTQTSGNTASIASPNDPATLVFGLTTGVYEFTWTATTLNNDGCSSTDTMQIEIFAQPVNANAGPDQTLPQFSPVVMAATTPTVGQGEWVKFSGPPSSIVFADVNSPTTTVSGLAVGTTVLEWRVTNGPCTAATDQVSITILAQTDLELTKSVTPTSVKVGDEVTFTINVLNKDTGAGTVNATGVSVKDVLPNGYTLVAGSVTNGGIYNAGNFTITWVGLNVALGTTTQLTFKAKVTNTGNYLNTAQVTACDQFDIDSTPNNNVASEDDQSSVAVTILPTAVDLSLTKTVVNNELTPLIGTAIAFEVRVKNSSLDNATGVQIRDLLPSGYSYQIYNSTKGAYEPTTGIWNVGLVEAGVEEVLTLTVLVNPTGDYLNIAEVFSCDQPDIDSTPNNGVLTEDDYASVLTTPVKLEADLSLTKKIVGGNTNRLVGSQVSFTVVVSNAGSQTTSGVIVKDLLPTGFTFVSSSVTSGAYDEVSGNWTVGSMVNGASETLLVTATVNATGDYKNNAEVTASSLADPDSTPNNGENAEDDFATITVIPVVSVADLSLTKTVVGGNTSPLVGSPITFQIIVTNDGPQSPTGIQVKDLLPTGYTYVGSAPSTGTYNPATGIWNIGPLANGTSTTITINATVKTTGIYTNVAEITASSLPDLDSTPNNGNTTVAEDDYASVIITPIKTEADLSLTKTIVGGNVNRLVGSQVTFNVIINNAGSQATSGVTVKDLLPSGFTFVSSSISVGAYNETTGVWTIGALANGASETLTVTATVNATGIYTNVAEVTASSLPDPDSTPNNAVITEDDYGTVTVVPVTATADLSLTKTIFGGNVSPAVGASITFQIITTNDGPQNATGVQVTDLLPTGYTYVGSSPTVGTYNPATGLWNINTLANGASATLTVNATVNATGTYTNIAEVTASSLPDLDSTPNNGITTEDDYASVLITPIKQEADLSLTKTIVGGNTNHLIGSQVTFNVVVNNAGPQTTTGAVVTDLLPSGLTYVSSTFTAGSYIPATGLWNVGTLANGGSTTLIVTATVNATGNHTNKAEVTASSLTDPDSIVNNGITTEDDYASVTIVPVTAVADLSLTKIIVGGNASPLVGASVSFQIVATNNSSTQNVTGVQVKDILPSGFTYVSSLPTVGTYNETTGIWNINNLANNTSVTLTVGATVNATGNYTNIAEISASSLPDPDSTPNNGITTEDDYASVIVTPIKQQADLSLTKIIVDGNTNRLVGSQVTFNVVVNNAGAQNASGVTVKDLLPSGFTFVSSSVTTGAYNQVNGVWNIGALANGATETLIVNATVKSTGNHTNTAEISASSLSDPDSTPNNGVTTEDDYGSVTVVPVTAIADLSLTKIIVGGNTTPLVGDSVSFQIVATNDGPQDATGVQVKDVLPTGYTYVGSIPSAGTYNPANGIWNINALANGASATLTVSVTVNATGVYTNVAEVSASSLPDLDSTPNNGITTEDDYASVIVTPIKTEADLSLTKTIVGGNTNRLVGSQVVFNVVVNNAGPQPTSGVTVLDQLPTGFTYVSSTVTAGAYVPGTGVWSVGTLANGGSATLIVTATVNASGIYKNTAEITASSLSDPDSVVNNGENTEDDFASITVVPVVATADLSLTKTIVGGNASPLVGTSISFQIVATNNGPQNTTGVQVKDLLPTGYTYTISTATAGTYNPTTGIWNIGALANGVSETLTVNATVKATGDYTNIAEITASSLPDLDSTPNNGITTEDDYASVVVTPIKQEADLSLTKTIVGGNVNRLIGSEVTFNVVVNNAGPQTAPGVTVTDLLPSGFTLVSSSITTGGYNTTTGVWTIGSLVSGASETLTVTATVNASGVRTNKAEVTASGISDPDSTPNNGVITEDDYGSVTVVPVTATADLSLTKTIVGGNASPLVGSSISFQVIATNDGPQNATGVQVKDLLPTGYSYVGSAPSVGTYNSTTGIWNINALANGASATLTVNATVKPTGVYTNVAEVSASSLPDLDSTPNNGITTEDDYASVIVTPVKIEADLSLTKTIVGGNLNRLVGSQVTFNVVVNNAGTQATSGVTVLDLLPTGFTYVSSVATTGSYVSGTGVWTIGALANGASETLSVTATVNATGIYKNTAEVTASSLSDPDSVVNNGENTEDDFASLTVIPVTATADLSLTKTLIGGNTSPLVGASISFQVITTNNGPQDVTGVQVKDLLPTGYTYIGSAPSTGTYNATTGIWSIPSLANGASTTLTVNASVKATGVYTNIAEITASSLPDLDSTPNNGVTTEDDYASVVVTPIKQEADLSLTKTIVGGNTNRLIGSEVIFNIVVNNAGPQTASGITVKDLLPSGFTFVSSSLTTGVYNEVNGVWNIGTLINGASETLTVTAKVVATGNHTNKAEITASSIADPDSTPNNGVITEDDYGAIIVVPVTAVADLSLTKTIVGGNASPLVGSSISFQITATNDGPQNTTGVQVKDILPSGYTYVISTATAGTYNPTTGIWNINNLANGASETLMVNATIKTAGVYMNVAEITASSLPDLDSTPNNGITTEDDYASVIVTPVKLEADLSLTKTIVGGNVNRLIGSQVTFNVVVTNAGPQATSGVQVKDVLPNGFTFVSSNVTAGGYNSTTGLWNVGALANGVSETLIVTATVNATGNYTNVAEITASNLTDPDSVVNNGSTTEDDYASITVIPVTAVADLSLTKTIVGGNATPLVGTQISFQVIVSNAGPQDVTNIQVKDLLPSGYTYVISTATKGIYTPATGLWNIANLANGTSETLTVNATVNATGIYTNIAEITASSLPDLDSTPNNGNVTEDDYASVIVTPIKLEADLSLTKTIVGGNTNRLIGSPVTFNVIVNNAGPRTASGVALTDLLPSGFIFVSSNVTTGAYNSTSGVWTVETLVTGASETLVVNATVNASGNHTNKVEITNSSIADPDSTPNNGVVTEDDYASITVIPVTAVADLSLTKTIVGGNASPLVGSSISFQVVATNNGPQNATGVQVKDLLPSGYTYVISTTTAGTYNPATGIWNINNFANGASETLTVNAKVNAIGNYTNVAEIFASSLPDLDSTPNNGIATEDDYASVVVTPVKLEADLSLAKSVVRNNTSPLVGASISFQVLATNNGPQDATGVQVKDILPTGYTYVISTTSAGTYNATTGIWNINNIVNGALETLTVNATVNATGVYTNVAEIIASSLPDPDSTPNNGNTLEDDYASVVVTPIIPQADLSLTKTIVGGNATPLVGSSISFEIIATNNGPQDVTGVQVKDLLPTGYTYTISTPSAGIYNSTTGIWTIGVLPNGASENLLINAIVKATGIYTNVAEITASSLFDPNSTPNNGVITENDYASVVVTPVTFLADLSLTKTVVGGNTSPAYGTTVTFQVTVTNNGPQATTNVKVKDILPNGYTYTVYSSTAGVYNEVTGIWNIGSIANGTFENLLISAVVKRTGNYLNTAEVIESSLPDPDSTPNNGITTEDDFASLNLTPVNEIADLSISKLVVNDNITPLVGSQITFQITVTNSGPNIATGVEVKDILPSGYDYVFFNASSGSYDRITGIWNPGIILPNSSQTLLMNVLVKTPTGATNEFLNIAEVSASDQFDLDSTPNNGITTEDDYDSISVTPVIVVADLSIEKTIINNQKPNVGDIVTFQIKVSNEGPGNATGVQVKDLLPSGFTYVSHNATSGIYTFTDGRWIVGSILNGNDQTLLVYARVNPVTRALNEFLNVAEITASNLPDPDSTPNNGVITEDDYDSIDVEVQIANLSLHKSVSNVKANVGEEVTFTVQIENAGPVVATGVSIEDLLPIGYSNITNVTNGGIYRSFRIAWSNLIIPLSGLTINYQATVESPIGLTDSDYINTAQITASNQFDPNSTPNNDDGDQSEDDEDNAHIEVPKTDIAIIKTVDAVDPSIGAEINFIVTADNIGSLNATNVEVEDVLPAGYQFISATATSGEYNVSNGIWKIPSVEVNSAQTLTVKVKVLDTNDYLNIAKLVALDQIDTNASNNESSATIKPTCLKIYNEFSPDGDGTNDVFYIDCIANYPNNKFEVFNRWGNLVYAKNGYKNTWDGTSDGPEKVLPTGTYFFILDLGDGSDKTSGWLYLKR
ncbi:gliding motility-associated C-terminal domain-containing protein [Flavobacterium sp. 5]|uniref:PKD domain-containing protein n=1 Tax=Flavobacterium sp. 5 TaxID=2035199 RepID=UPI000C2BE1B9|nr:gliding motility-associated C-terminal domain-containing protein [Flavobacterium sp. 5]PKB18980.1 putative repeat protein (TIGR01451 family)/gliding motility-associated-like protein [Flavobacterium sp. 5]